MKNLLLMSLALMFVTSCAQYKYANKIKLVSFSDDFSKGKSVGRIEGKDCTWMVLGYWLGGNPTLDKAFMEAQNQKGGKLKYLNNVMSEKSGWSVGTLVAKQCLAITGKGYK